MPTVRRAHMRRARGGFWSAVRRHLVKTSAQKAAARLERQRKNAEVEARARELAEQRVARIEAKARLVEARNELRRQKQSKKELKAHRRDLRSEQKLRRAALKEQRAESADLRRQRTFDRKMAHREERLTERQERLGRKLAASGPAPVRAETHAVSSPARADEGMEGA